MNILQEIIEEINIYLKINILRVKLIKNDIVIFYLTWRLKRLKIQLEKLRS
jgi:hypothetical protein